MSVILTASSSSKNPIFLLVTSVNDPSDKNLTFCNTFDPSLSPPSLSLLASVSQSSSSFPCNYFSCFPSTYSSPSLSASLTPLSASSSSPSLLCCKTQQFCSQHISASIPPVSSSSSLSSATPPVKKIESVGLQIMEPNTPFPFFNRLRPQVFQPQFLLKETEKEEEKKKREKKESKEQIQSQNKKTNGTRKPPVKAENSVIDFDIRNKRYDGQRLCLSRECCRLFKSQNSSYCRKKCQNREQNISQNKVHENREKIRKKQEFIWQLEATTIVTDTTGPKKMRISRKREEGDIDEEL